MIRSVIEMFRGDKLRGVGVLGTPLSTSQFISVGVALVAAYLFFYLRKQRGGDSAGLEVEGYSPSA